MATDPLLAATARVRRRTNTISDEHSKLVAKAYSDAYTTMADRIVADQERRMEQYGQATFDQEEVLLADLGRELDEIIPGAAAEIERGMRLQVESGIRGGQQQVELGLTDIGVQIGGLNERAVSEMADRAMEERDITKLLQGANDAHKAKLAGILLKQQTLGNNPREAARELRNTLGKLRGGTMARWLTVARTEMNDASRRGLTALYTRHGDVLRGKEWIATLDRRTCMACIALDGTILALDAKEQQHQNCVPAEDWVMSTDVEIRYRRWYDGPLVEVVTRNNKFRATPNHPVLTSRGWVALDRLQISDQVISYTGVQSSIRQPYIINEPGRIGEEFDSVSGTRTMERVPGGSSDFHGDGGNGHIDIIRADSLLRGWAESSENEQIENLLFNSRKSAERLSLNSSTMPGFGGYAAEPGQGIGSTLLRARLISEDLVGFGLCAQHNSRFFKPSSDSRSTDAEVFGQLQLQPSLPIKPDHLLLINQLRSSDGLGGQSSSVNPELIQSVPDGVGSYPVEPSQVLGRLAGQVFLDEVVSIRRYPFSGHVFNLQTADGWYGASISHTGTLVSSVLSNCRCSLLPVVKNFPGVKQRKRRLAQQWFKAQKAAVKEEMMGKGAYRMYRHGQLSISDFAHLKHNHGWRDAIYASSLAQAKQNAFMRQHVFLATIRKYGLGGVAGLAGPADDVAVLALLTSRRTIAFALQNRRMLAALSKTPEGRTLIEQLLAEQIKNEVIGYAKALTKAPRVVASPVTSRLPDFERLHQLEGSVERGLHRVAERLANRIVQQASRVTPDVPIKTIKPDWIKLADGTVIDKGKLRQSGFLPPDDLPPDIAALRRLITDWVIDVSERKTPIALRMGIRGELTAKSMPRADEWSHWGERAESLRIASKITPGRPYAEKPDADFAKPWEANEELVRATWQRTHAAIRNGKRDGTMVSIVDSIDTGEYGNVIIRGKVYFTKEIIDVDVVQHNPLFYEHVAQQVTGVRTTAGVKDYGWNWEPVGTFHRSIRVSDARVYHASLFIQDEKQGYGFATVFNFWAFSYYVSHGIKEIGISTVQVGGYAWATHGFEFRNPGTAMGMIDNRHAQINRMLADGHVTEQQLAEYLNEILANEDRGGMLSFELSQLGRENSWKIIDFQGIERDMWFGKAIMLNQQWDGKLILSPPAPGEFKSGPKIRPRILYPRFPRRLDLSRTAMSRLGIDLEPMLRQAFIVALNEAGLAEQVAIRFQTDRLLQSLDDLLKQQPGRITLIEGVRAVIDQDTRFADIDMRRVNSVLSQIPGENLTTKQGPARLRTMVPFDRNRIGEIAVEYMNFPDEQDVYTFADSLVERVNASVPAGVSDWQIAIRGALFDTLGVSGPDQVVRRSILDQDFEWVPGLANRMLEYQRTEHLARQGSMAPTPERFSFPDRSSVVPPFNEVMANDLYVVHHAAGTDDIEWLFGNDTEEEIEQTLRDFWDLYHSGGVPILPKEVMQVLNRVETDSQNHPYLNGLSEMMVQEFYRLEGNFARALESAFNELNLWDDEMFDGQRAFDDIMRYQLIQDFIRWTTSPTAPAAAPASALPPPLNGDQLQDMIAQELRITYPEASRIVEMFMNNVDRPPAYELDRNGWITHLQATFEEFNRGALEPLEFDSAELAELAQRAAARWQMTGMWPDPVPSPAQRTWNQYVAGARNAILNTTRETLAGLPMVPRDAALDIVVQALQEIPSVELSDPDDLEALTSAVIRRLREEVESQNLTGTAFAEELIDQINTDISEILDQYIRENPWMRPDQRARAVQAIVFDEERISRLASEFLDFQTEEDVDNFTRFLIEGVPQRQNLPANVGDWEVVISGALHEALGVPHGQDAESIVRLASEIFERQDLDHNPVMTSQATSGDPLMDILNDPPTQPVRDATATWELLRSTVQGTIRTALESGKPPNFEDIKKLAALEGITPYEAMARVLNENTDIYDAMDLRQYLAEHIVAGGTIDPFNRYAQYLAHVIGKPVAEVIRQAYEDAEIMGQDEGPGTPRAWGAGYEEQPPRPGMWIALDTGVPGREPRVGSITAISGDMIGVSWLDGSEVSIRVTDPWRRVAVDVLPAERTTAEVEAAYFNMGLLQVIRNPDAVYAVLDDYAPREISADLSELMDLGEQFESLIRVPDWGTLADAEDEWLPLVMSALQTLFPGRVFDIDEINRLIERILGTRETEGLIWADLPEIFNQWYEELGLMAQLRELEDPTGVNTSEADQRFQDLQERTGVVDPADIQEREAILKALGDPELAIENTALRRLGDLWEEFNDSPELTAALDAIPETLREYEFSSEYQPPIADLETRISDLGSIDDGLEQFEASLEYYEFEGLALEALEAQSHAYSRAWQQFKKRKGIDHA